MTVLLRLEGANFDATMLDTSDLSTVRGASRALLKAPDTALAAVKLIDPAAEFIYSGASEALIVCPGLNKVGSLVETVRHVLAQGPGGAVDPLGDALRHMSFLVTAKEVGPSANAVDVANDLVAEAKIRQWQEPTLDLASAADQSAAHCEIDRTRPGFVRGEGREKDRCLSHATFHRRHYGRHHKHGFYREEVGKVGMTTLPVKDFSDDFDDIVKNGRNGLPESLKNKMAVLYLDGNGFQSKRNAAAQARGIEGYGDFSSAVRKQQQSLLRNILNWIAATPDMLNGDKARFETILWGGDEMMFVLPGWRALDFAALVGSAVEGWRVTIDGKEEKLTFAAGLVVCNYKTPIRAVTKLARELAEGAKDLSRDRNLLQYAVLDSVDPPMGDLAALRLRYFGASGGAAYTLPFGAKFAEVIEWLKAGEDLPPSQRHDLVRQAVADGLFGGTRFKRLAEGKPESDPDLQGRIKDRMVALTDRAKTLAKRYKMKALPGFAPDKRIEAVDSAGAPPPRYALARDVIEPPPAAGVPRSAMVAAHPLAPLLHLHALIDLALIDLADPPVSAGAGGAP